MFKRSPDIGKLTSKHDVSGLARALRHSDPAIRRDAAVALGRLGDPRVIEPLLELLPDHAGSGDPDLAVRVAAVQALGLLGDPRALHHLLGCQARDVLFNALPTEPEQRAATFDSIAAIGQRHRRELGEALASGIAQVTSGQSESFEFMLQPWARLVAGIGPLAVATLLTATASDTADETGIRVVLRLVGEPALEPCLAAMIGPVGIAKARAGVVLGAVGDERAVGPLAACQEIVSLAELGGAAAFDALRGLFDGADASTRRLVLEHIAQTGEQRSIDVLLAGMQDDDLVVRATAAYQLLIQLQHYRHRLIHGSSPWLNREMRYGLASDPRPRVRRDPLTDSKDAPEVLHTESEATRVLEALESMGPATPNGPAGWQVHDLPKLRKSLQHHWRDHLHDTEEHTADVQEHASDQST